MVVKISSITATMKMEIVKCPTSEFPYLNLRSQSVEQRTRILRIAGMIFVREESEGKRTRKVIELDVLISRSLLLDQAEVLIKSDADPL